jgi:isoleucyl-tRNA synthetase
MMESRPDWCLSRQRIWGIPIPVLICVGCKRSILDPAFIRRVRDIFKREGSDSWFKKSAAEFAEDGFTCVHCGGNHFNKGNDILDVWFESGSSHIPVLVEKGEGWFPADLYLEGSDQHRGWFQSSLLVSYGLFETPPYRAVLTHGFIVDGDGRKMSKSQGNTISPQDVTQRYGADILRLWVASSDTSDDIRISEDSLGQLADGYRKIRNTFKYILGNLKGFRVPADLVAIEDLYEVDRWALAKLEILKQEARQAYENFELHRLYHAVYNFCVKEMSSFYLDVLKDRLYADPCRSVSGASCRTALYEILLSLTRILAPILSFTAEEVWESLGMTSSVHLEPWPVSVKSRVDALLLGRWERLLVIREKVLKALEEKREKKEIGNSLEAEVELTLFKIEDLEFLRSFGESLAGLFLVSKIVLTAGEAGLGAPEVLVRRAEGKKCERCWNYRTSVGQDNEHATICDRCAKVIKGV